ncbi:hypothetical protein ERJ75_000225500 [Trypanosoma vivax]|nr:hypothetical protein ERJ75_000225500 [Trypanosoma vivax]
MAPKICHAVFFSLDPEKMAANLPGNAVEENLQRLRDTVPGLLEVNMGRAETALFPGYVACCAITRSALCPSTSMPPRSRRARPPQPSGLRRAAQGVVCEAAYPN